MEGMQSWEEQKRNPTSEFHPAEKTDPAELLVAKLGEEGALDELQEKLQQNRGDEEALRQLELIRNRAEDIVRRAQEIKNSREQGLH